MECAYTRRKEELEEAKSVSSRLRYTAPFFLSLLYILYIYIQSFIGLSSASSSAPLFFYIHTRRFGGPIILAETDGRIWSLDLEHFGERALMG